MNHDDVFSDGDGFFGAVFEKEVELICVGKLEFHLKRNVEDWAKLDTSHGLAPQHWPETRNWPDPIGEYTFDCSWNKIDTLSHLIAEEKLFLS